MYYIIFTCRTQGYEVILEVEGITLSKYRTQIKQDAINHLLLYTVDMCMK